MVLVIFQKLVSMEILLKKWIDKLNAPKGLTISKDKLYIADVDELVEVDIASAKITNKFKGYGSVCMNDVTHDKYGNVYVGDTYNDTIYRLNQFGQLPAWFTALDLHLTEFISTMKKEIL